MTEHGEMLVNVLRRLEAVERANAQLTRSVCGYFRPVDAVTSIEDRLRAVEQSGARELVAQNEPVIIRAGQGAAEFDDAVVTDIEYGLVKTEPTATESATIVLRPCDKAGVEYTGASDVTVYVCRDRATVDQSVFGWTTATILTWLRFSSQVNHSGTYVDGVAIGGVGGDPDATTEASYAFSYRYVWKASPPYIETTAAFWSKADLLNHFIEIGLDVRLAVDSGATDPPNDVWPGISGAMAGIAWGNVIGTYSGKDDTWFDLSYTYRDSEAGHDASKHGVGALGGDGFGDFGIQARITTAGVLELRVYQMRTISDFPVIITGFVRVIKHPDPATATAFGGGA